MLTLWASMIIIIYTSLTLSFLLFLTWNGSRYSGFRAYRSYSLFHSIIFIWKLHKASVIYFNTQTHRLSTECRYRFFYTKFFRNLRVERAIANSYPVPWYSLYGWWCLGNSKYYHRYHHDDHYWGDDRGSSRRIKNYNSDYYYRLHPFYRFYMVQAIM